MTAFPSYATITDQTPAFDGPAAAAAFGDFLKACLQLPGAQLKSQLTIAADVITPTRFLHTIETEGGAAGDDVRQIALANLPDGSALALAPHNIGHVVTFRHLNGTGVPGTNGEMVLNNNEDFAFASALDRLILVRDGAQWVELLRLSVFGRRLAGAQNAAAALAVLGAGNTSSLIHASFGGP